MIAAQWWKKSSKSGELQPFSSSFLNFFSFFLSLFVQISPWASFDTPWQWLWSINHLFPELSVPACSEMKQQPLDHRHGRFQPFLLRFSAKAPHAQQSNVCAGGAAHTHTFQTIWFVFRQSTDKALLMLIKDDVSEIYTSNAKRWFNVGCIGQMSFVKQILAEKILSSLYIRSLPYQI